MNLAQCISIGNKENLNKLGSYSAGTSGKEYRFANFLFLVYVPIEYFIVLDMTWCALITTLDAKAAQFSIKKYSKRHERILKMLGLSHDGPEFQFWFLEQKESEAKYVNSHLPQSFEVLTSRF